MTASAAIQAPVQTETPLAGFSRCHLGILSRLESLAELPVLAVAADRARRVAADTLELFEPSVFEHHADEEDDLFPAVRASAAEGEERDRVLAMVLRLTEEHRCMESLWKRIKPAVRLIASGKPAELDSAALEELVNSYIAHARFEEQAFLPVAQQILGRNGNHLAALGIALHMRHVPQPLGYI